MKFKGFYDVLKENIDTYRGEYEMIIDYAPDIFKLLSDLLNDERINARMRLMICAALGYFVAPYDILPEEIYGPQGYIDDIYLSSLILGKIAEKTGYKLLEEYWRGEEDLKSVIRECQKRSKEILGKDTEKILSYVGLEKALN
ncbi:MAG: YkvA family protein [Methanothermobacter sp.]